MRMTLSDVNAKYMPTGNCDELIASFHPNDLAEQAADDFTFYDARGGDSQERYRVTPKLNCFCGNTVSVFDGGYSGATKWYTDSKDNEA